MKKGILISLIMLSTFEVFAEEVKYICLQKCFQQCKFKSQAVKDCQITHATTVSFRINCECRDLKPGEVLPAFFHKTRIIKTSAS